MNKHEYWALIESHISISLVFFFFCNFFGSIIEQSHMESVSAKLHSKWIIESNQCSCLTSKPTMMFIFRDVWFDLPGNFPALVIQPHVFTSCLLTIKEAPATMWRVVLKQNMENAKSADSMLALLKVLTTYTMNINSQKREKESL